MYQYDHYATMGTLVHICVKMRDKFSAFEYCQVFKLFLSFKNNVKKSKHLARLLCLRTAPGLVDLNLLAELMVPESAKSAVRPD